MTVDGKKTALRDMTNKQMQCMGSQLDFGPCVPPTVDRREEIVRRFQTEQGIAVDGWPGNTTYYTLWSLGYRPPTPAALVATARSWCHIGTDYKLGAGGYQWFPDFPSTKLDCSGFIASVLERSRKPQTDFPFWLSTDSIWNDCAGSQLLFAEIPEPISGCIIVYPDVGGKQGHVGIVTTVAGTNIAGVDCSSSASYTHGDAITERNFNFFLARGDVRLCVPTWVVSTVA
jgi:hypothetical protein